jgi:D-tyrosyl-tRNA(Tyr) deacylase
MRAVVQRVSSARVRVGGELVGAIDGGLCVLVGAGAGDTDADLDYLAAKVANLRVFEDDDGKMNRSLLDTGGGCLVVSQFTLYGDARKGRRPSFVAALAPEIAEPMVARLVDRLRGLGVAQVATGRFRATMEVELINHGPVTILLDSRKAF